MARFSILGRLRSFRYAIAGVGFMLRTQHNAWLHLAATIGVVAVGLFLRVDPYSWCWLIAAVALVWMAEAFNTAIEHLCNVVSPGYSEAVKHAKDIAAGAVLICALAAALIGAMTFWPYVRPLLGA